MSSNKKKQEVRRVAARRRITERAPSQQFIGGHFLKKCKFFIGGVSLNWGMVMKRQRPEATRTGSEENLSAQDRIFLKQ